MTSNNLLLSIGESAIPEENYQNSCVADYSDQEPFPVSDINQFEAKLDTTDGECAPLLVERHYHSNHFSGMHPQILIKKEQFKFYVNIC